MKVRQIILIFALVLCMCGELTLGQTTTRIPFPQSAITFLASRKMRYHHYMWHQVRANWNKFTNETKAAFKKIGWEPPNPARTYDANGNSYVVTDNYSGEDFLYMHRNMIRQVNEVLTKNKERYGNVTSWTTIPAPGDKDWPVPPNYTVPGDPTFTNFINGKKTNNFYERTMKPNEALFKNPVELRKMTLAQMGAKMELAIHTWMHMRWSKNSTYGYRPGSGRNVPNFDKKWDDPQYTWMGDVYASHVDEIFWKLHCWVDDRIEDWRKANNIGTIRWRGTWIGGPMESIANVTGRVKDPMAGMTRGGAAAAQQNDGVGNTMQEALKIFADSGVKEFSFADDVRTPKGWMP